MSHAGKIGFIAGKGQEIGQAALVHEQFTPATAVVRPTARPEAATRAGYVVD